MKKSQKIGFSLLKNEVKYMSALIKDIKELFKNLYKREDNSDMLHGFDDSTKEKAAMVGFPDFKTKIINGSYTLSESGDISKDFVFTKSGWLFVWCDEEMQLNYRQPGATGNPTYIFNFKDFLSFPVVEGERIEIVIDLTKADSGNLRVIEFDFI